MKGALRKVLIEHTERFRGYIDPSCNTRKLTFSECLDVFAQPSWQAVESMLGELSKEKWSDRDPKLTLAAIGKKDVQVVSMLRFQFKRRSTKFSRSEWVAILKKLYSDPANLRLVYCDISETSTALLILEQSLLQPKPAVIWAPQQAWDAYADGHELAEDVSKQFDHVLK